MVIALLPIFDKTELYFRIDFFYQLTSYKLKNNISECVFDSFFKSTA